MVGKDDAPSGCEGHIGPREGFPGPCECESTGSRKMYWRSASWSSSRTSMSPLNPESESESERNHSNLNGNNNIVQGRKTVGPLTPRSQHSFKTRSCLPPLSIARRSLDEWPKASSDDIGEWPLATTPSGRDVNSCGERLKLDLSNIQRNPDKNCGLVKREKIAFFDKECSKVADHVYLGGDAVAKDREILKQHGITHILNCVGFVCPEYFKADFVYRTLWLQDSPSEDITSILYDVFDYFEDVREQGGRVFVHCCQGVSRSTSLVIAYVMWREGQSFDDAFQYVKAARSIADPNMGFACQLLQCQKRVHAFPLSPSSLLRMYRIAPHSPYDPLHLVPKMLNDPSPSALDSRGAFIIHIPSAIYVWIGKKCDIIMERDARGAVCQIVRYEKVQCPIVMIQEGEEPSYFWDAFSSLLPLMDKPSNGVGAVESSIKVCAGDRKVDSYSVDFEIFHKATMGGVVPPFAFAETEHETHLPARESSWSSFRRKFVPESMKEFICNTKSSPSVVYPDSFFVVNVQQPKNESYSSANLLLSSASSLSSSSSPLSSSSSSPPYFSPDSISSDASFGSACLGESPVASPSIENSSNLSSSVLPNFSDMTILSPRPSKLSPQSISKSSKFIDVNFNSHSCLKSISTPSKKFSLSIAERRGSLSKTLKLRTSTNEASGLDVPLNSVTNKKDLDIGGDDTLDRSQDAEHSTQSKEDLFHQDMNLQISLGRTDSCHDRAASRHHSYQNRETNQFEVKETSALPAVEDDRSGFFCSSQPIVCRWPNLEKVPNFHADDLDSHSAFVFIAPSSCMDKKGKMIMYFWVGRFFHFDRSRTHIESNLKFGDLEMVDWKQVTSDLLLRMNLPKDIQIQVCSLFLACLYSVQLFSVIFTEFVYRKKL